jgi:tetratricopeptide (TPR) repeat protein
MGSRILVLALSVCVFSLTALADPTAQRLLSAGRIDDAITSLQASIKVTPNDAESYNLLCRAYFTLSNWDAGASACEKAVALAPKNSLYHLWLGRIYGEKADHANFLSAAGLAKKVRAEFEAAARLDPDSVEARTDLAEFYLEAPGVMGGGKDKAEAEAQKLMTADPVKAHWVLGRVAEKRKDLATAEAEYRAAIQVSNGRADAWLNLALFYRHLGKFDKMEEAVRQISSAPANQNKVLMESAAILVRSGRDFPTAAKLLRQYLASSTVEEAPAFKAHYLLGTILEQQGDKQAAAEEYRASLAMVRNFALARDALDRLNSQKEHNG